MWEPGTANSELRSWHQDWYLWDEIRSYTSGHVPDVTGIGVWSYVKQTYFALEPPIQIFLGVREVELKPHPAHKKTDVLMTGVPGDDVAVTKLASLYVIADQPDDVSDTMSPHFVPEPPSSQAMRNPEAAV